MTSEKVKNVPSCLLTEKENRKVFRALGKSCMTLATTVVQLHLLKEPYPSSWVEKQHGVLCFVKDYDRHSYFLKLFDMDKCSWVWEHDLHNPFVHKPTRTYFHVLEVDNCRVGLNFAVNDEAQNFKSTVRKYIQMRENRRRQRRQRAQNIQPSNTGIMPAYAKSQSSQSLPNGKEEKSEKKTPSNFIFLQHPEKGFSLDSCDPELKDFLKLAGITDKHLNDCETRAFICDFINNHCVEKDEQEIATKGPSHEPIPDLPRTAARETTRSATPPHSVPPVSQPPHTFSNAPPPRDMPMGNAHQKNAPPPTDNRSALLEQMKKGKELHENDLLLL